MITKTVNLYRCEHCRKKKALRPAGILLHEVNCFSNPDRTPYPGELSQVDYEGTFDDVGWTKRATMPPWWPGATGLIFTGARWVPVPGYSRKPSPDGAAVADDETWPAVRPGWVDRLQSNWLPSTKPWYLRLEMLGIPQERRAEQLRRGLFLDAGDKRSARIAKVALAGEEVRVHLDVPNRTIVVYRRGDIVAIASFMDDRDAETEREW